jgi:hypothetical protein
VVVNDFAHEGMRGYGYAIASEPKLTSSSEVLQETLGLNVGKTADSNGIPNRVGRHIAMRVITLVTQVFNAVLFWQHFPPKWKHAPVFSILLPSSCRPIGLLETVGKVLEKILLTKSPPGSKGAQGHS